MKIRNGFVSNSSSSSFIAVGFWDSDDKKLFAEVIKALGIKECVDNGCDGYELEENGFECHGQGAFSNKDGICLFMCDSEISFIGLDAEEHFEQDGILSDLKKDLKKKLKKIGVTIELKDINLVCNEWGW